MYNCSLSAIKIQIKISSFFNLEREVKQGDSLIPILFNCFTNDLHDIFDNTCIPLGLEKSKVASLSFADDLVILSNTSEGLQNSLNKLEKYCYDWQLTVNTKKTKVMIFQNTQSPSPNFYYKNVLLTQ
jgi:hypothetical protein